MGIFDRQELNEFGKTLVWYVGRKATIIASHIEGAKGLIVDVLKARRGTYQKPFLHVGMVFLTVVAVVWGPLIVSQYPMAANAQAVTSSTSPSAVLNNIANISDVDTSTTESVKPRRDVEEYEVKSGDTLSSIAKQFDVDTDSINYLNDFPEERILKPGEKIKIPPVAGIIVKVKSGDTIASLAKKYGIPSSQAIVDWPYNEFADDETFALSAGQSLVIPGGKPPAAAPAPAPRQISSLSTPFTGGSGQFIWPTGGIMTQYYSWYHPGFDIAAAVGTPIRAADSGRVVTVLYQNHDYGFHVIIDHGNGTQTLYGHMSRIDVSEGQNVSRGQQIGLMGSTGRSTGSHLHFEIHVGGRQVNPSGYLR